MLVALAMVKLQLLLPLLVCLSGSSAAPFNARPTAAQGGWPATDEELDCSIRQLALEYAASLEVLDADGLRAVVAGLQLDDATDCTRCAQAALGGGVSGGDAAPSAAAGGSTRHLPRSLRPASSPPPPPPPPVDRYGTALYVDSAVGVDGPGAGSAARPFKTVAAAAAAAAAAVRRPVGILLWAGLAMGRRVILTEYPVYFISGCPYRIYRVASE